MPIKLLGNGQISNPKLPALWVPQQLTYLSFSYRLGTICYSWCYWPRLTRDFDVLFRDVFSTSLPLASTRWIRLTLSRLCPLFKAVLSINLSNVKRKNSLECRESNPGLLGEKQECYLCAMQPDWADSGSLEKRFHHHHLEQKASLERKSLIPLSGRSLKFE